MKCLYKRLKIGVQEKQLERERIHNHKVIAMLRAPSLILVVSLTGLLMCPALFVQAQEIIVKKDNQGIRLTQKRKPIPPKAEEAGKTAPKKDDSKQQPPPKDKDDPGKKPQSPGKTPDDPKSSPPPKGKKKPVQPEAENQKKLPLEQNPAYVEELNKLTEQYNQRKEALQRRAEDLVNQYNDTFPVLQQRVRDVEEEMARIQDIKGAKREFMDLNTEYQSRQQDLMDFNQSYNDENDAIQEDVADLDDWYELEKKKLEKRFR